MNLLNVLIIMNFYHSLVLGLVVGNSETCLESNNEKHCIPKHLNYQPLFGTTLKDSPENPVPSLIIPGFRWEIGLLISWNNLPTSPSNTSSVHQQSLHISLLRWDFNRWKP